MKTAISLALAIAAVTLAPGAQAAAPALSGEAIYARCLGCHALAYDRTGPRHCGLLGRRAGSVPGFAYSEAMKRAGIVWDARTLNRFLADPGRTVPGTSMTYAGVKDPAERRALIDYLRRAASGPECRG
ncbi:MAG: c-type cytochrome [Massilia sp.]